MTDAHALPTAARDVLNRAERAASTARATTLSTVHWCFSHPPGTDEQVRTHPSNTDVPQQVTGVWSWCSYRAEAQLNRMDLDRVLVLNAEKRFPLVDPCALLVDACDVILPDIPELSRPHQRVSAARTLPMGTHHRDAFPGRLFASPLHPRMRLVIGCVTWWCGCPDRPVHCLVKDRLQVGPGPPCMPTASSVAAQRLGRRQERHERARGNVYAPMYAARPRSRGRAFSAVVGRLLTRWRLGQCMRPAWPGAGCEARLVGMGARRPPRLLVSAIEAVGAECFVGIADGPVAL